MCHENQKKVLINKSRNLDLDLPRKIFIDDVRREVFGEILGKELGTQKAEETTGLHDGADSLEERDISLQKAEGGVPKTSNQCSLQENEQCDENVKEDAEDPLKQQTRCWNKGNWLSFTANIANQIFYLGCLLLLWYVNALLLLHLSCVVPFTIIESTDSSKGGKR